MRKFLETLLAEARTGTPAFFPRALRPKASTGAQPAMDNSPGGFAADARRGMVLVAVLVVIVLLSLGAYSYLDLMSARHKASSGAVRMAQAKHAAESGIHFVAAALADPAYLNSTLGGNPYDNPQVFQAMLIQESDVPGSTVRCSIVSPRDDDITGIGLPRSGVTDEAGKININALMVVDPTGKMLYDALIKLPYMTADIANSIVYWGDPAAAPRLSDDGGVGAAENSTYESKSPPYRAKNGPLTSLEELLWVEGVTPVLLFGIDLNRNGAQDANEIAEDGIFDRGWSAYLTIYGREPNKDSVGNPRVDLSNADLAALVESLTLAGFDSEMIAYILLVRNYGVAAAATTTVAAAVNPTTGTITVRVATPAPAAPATTPASLSSVDIAAESAGTGGKKVSSLYDLIDTTVQVPGTGNNASTLVYTSPLSSADPDSLHAAFALLFEKAALNPDLEVIGRININTAPEAVIRTLPNLTEEEFEMILSVRPALGVGEGLDEVFKTPMWLFTEAGIPVAKVKQLEKYITTTTQVYRFQSVGYFEGGDTPAQTAARYEAVVDINNGLPRILYQRDISTLGKGYNTNNQQQ